jgi:hypothetical protein
MCNARRKVFAVATIATEAPDNSFKPMAGKPVGETPIDNGPYVD